MNLMNVLVVALGGALGSSARFFLSATIQDRVQTLLPLGTISVNILGSFLIGLVYAIIRVRAGSAEFLTLFVVVGLLGGFTTFSAFSLETLGLIEAGLFVKAALNVVVSVFCCIFAVFMGVNAGDMLIKNF